MRSSVNPPAQDNPGSREIGFIASRYRSGRFAVRPALERVMGRRPRIRWWTPLRIAAASAVLVVLGATATVIIRQSLLPDTPVESAASVPAASPAVAVVRTIDFESAPLPAVVDRIREVYGVEVVNLPSDADGYRLSLHYEGTAAELVETINEILSTEMKIEE